MQNIQCTKPVTFLAMLANPIPKPNLYFYKVDIVGHVAYQLELLLCSHVVLVIVSLLNFFGNCIVDHHTKQLTRRNYTIEMLGLFITINSQEEITVKMLGLFITILNPLVGMI